MAMAMSQQQAWGKKKIGSWADESEAAEAESGGAPVAEDAFPSLTQAAAKSKKKTKGQTLTLAEFTTGQYIGPGAKRSSLNSANIFTSDDRLTTEEKLYLPKGPKERAGEDLHEQRLGGGFRGYGGGFRGDRDQGYHHQRYPREDRDVPMSMPPPPSRADESSDWFSGKTERTDFHKGGGGYENKRYGGDREYGPSKADEVESWTAGKKFVPSEPSRTYSDGVGGARRGRSDVVERWPSKDMGAEDRWGKHSDEAPQRRRLNLQPRTLPVDQQSADSRPSSSHSSRPGTPGDAQSQADVAPKPRSNPFGSAKPRELVLEERGQDWRKLDSELELKRYETEAEKKLKEEIESLKSSTEAENPDTIHIIQLKEQQLLALELETKARLSEPAPPRQQLSRRTSDNLRPPSSHENRSRPPSSHDSWSRPPSAHDNRSSRPPSAHGRNTPETWRRPLHENEGSWRKDRPRTPAGGDYGYNRPMTPDMWRREQDHRPATPNFGSGENDFGRADMWSRPRTPSDEWNSGKRMSNSYQTSATMSRW